MWVAQQWGSAFPYGTLLINVLGSFVLGAFLAYVAVRPVGPELRLFVATGLCGGFTTFSTFSAEALALLERGSYSAAVCYIVASVALGLLAALTGLWLVRALLP
jgi:fluoride exporter